ncbi:uncharacterized protein LOC144440988 isoform X2 [Glandiceps talaboti]
MMKRGPQLMSRGQQCKVTEQIITTTTSTPIHSYYMGAMKELSGPDISEISAASESDRHVQLDTSNTNGARNQF